MRVSLLLLAHFFVLKFLSKLVESNALDLLILLLVFLFKFAHLLVLDLVVILVNKVIFNHVLKLSFFGDDLISGNNVSILISFLKSLMLLSSCLHRLDKRIVHVLHVLLRLLNNSQLIRRQISYDLIVLLIKTLLFVVFLSLC